MVLSQSPSHPVHTQTVRLRQPMVWSRAIAFGIVGLIGFTTLWAAVSTTEEVVSASGKLEPEGSVKEIQSPSNGVIQEVLVRDGQRVKKGEVLIRFESSAENAKLASLQRIRVALVQENQFYQQQLAGEAKTVVGMTALQRTQQALLAENAVYRAQIGSATRNSLNPEQQQRLQSRESEFRSRLTAAELQVDQMQQQLRQVEIQIATAKTQLAAAQTNLKIEEGVLKDLEPAVAEGAIAKVRLSEQRQKILQNQTEVTKVLQEQQRLQAEWRRLQLDQEKAREQVQSITASNREDIFSRISTNEKSLAELDGNIQKIVLDNQKKIAEIDSQLIQAKQAVQFQELRSPVDGVVFELKSLAVGSVASPGTTLAKIVPQDALIAKVFISNKDIGFVQEGMEVSVKLDSFPSQEFGDVKGTLEWIGSDALPPEQIRPYYHFPARVRLQKSSLRIHRREVSLQSGMAFNATIKIRDRTVLSIFTGALFQQADGLKSLR